MSRQPTAPRTKLVLCRICGKPDYLEGLCFAHYNILKRGIKSKPWQTDRQQDEDREREALLECGCPRFPEGVHKWDCANNPSREVGQEYIFDPVAE